MNSEQPVRYDQGKAKIALVPPRALLAVAWSLTNDKYPAHNYLKIGYTHTDLISKAMRHINSHLSGINVDEESGNLHLANAASNLMMLIELMSLNRDIDDRYKEEK